MIKKIKCLFGQHTLGKQGEDDKHFYLHCHNCNHFKKVLKEDINNYKLYGSIKRPTSLQIKLRNFLKKHKLYYKFKLYNFI
jgi:hypothetical protein